MIFEKQVLAMYKKMAYARCDDEGAARYFSAGDFEGLLSRPYYFMSCKGHVLRGYFYNYPQPAEKRLVVFDHGFGGGHRSYMKEIERLCRAGFTVFAYDHTGCMESEGEGANGMSQSLCDLNDCLNALRAALEGRENVTLVLEQGKGHNPNYTVGAVKYLSEYQSELKKAKKLNSPKEKADFVAKWDWDRMTEQDDAVWEKITEFLK